MAWLDAELHRTSSRQQFPCPLIPVPSAHTMDGSWACDFAQQGNSHWGIYQAEHRGDQEPLADSQPNVEVLITRTTVALNVKCTCLPVDAPDWVSQDADLHAAFRKACDVDS